MSHVNIHHEVSTAPTGDWRLCLQWRTYIFDEKPSENGYRFIWRRPDNSLCAARGQPIIHSVQEMLGLIEKARNAGWFGAVEQQSWDAANSG